MYRPIDRTTKQPGQQRQPQSSNGVMLPADDVSSVDDTTSSRLPHRVNQPAAESVAMATSSRQQCAKTSSSTENGSSQQQLLVDVHHDNYPLSLSNFLK